MRVHLLILKRERERDGKRTEVRIDNPEEKESSKHGHLVMWDHLFILFGSADKTLLCSSS